METKMTRRNRLTRLWIATVALLLVGGSGTKPPDPKPNYDWNAVDDEITAERIALAVARPLYDAELLEMFLPLQAHEEGRYWVVLGDDPYPAGDNVMGVRLYVKIRKRDAGIMLVTTR